MRIPSFEVALLLTAAAALSAPAALGASERPRLAVYDTIAAPSDLALGRYWHARRDILGLGRGAALSAQDQLNLAEAEAGLNNWKAVRDLMAGSDWADRLAQGRGAFLLGRALEELDEVDRAIEQYSHFESVAALDSRDLVSARMRRARLLAAQGRLPDVLAELSGLESERAGLASWVALEIAEDRAKGGDTDGVRTLFPRIVDPAAESAKWELLARAHTEQDDVEGALRAYLEVLPWMDDGAGRARVWAAIGAIRRDQGALEDAEDAFLNALGAAESGAGVVRASLGLVALGVDDADLAWRLGEVLREGGRSEEALKAYRRYAQLAGAEESSEARLVRGRLAAQRRQNDEAARALEGLIDSSDPTIGAPALETLIDVRRRQGRARDAQTLQDLILDRYPQSSQAAEILFFKADALHDDGRLGEAAAIYQKAMEADPTSNRGGLSAMRLAQLHISRAEHAQAADLFEDFLERAGDEGDYVDEALYWAARSRIAAGEPTRATGFLERVRRRSPVTYYAVQTADLLGEPFAVPLPAVQLPPPPPWVAQAIELLGLLKENGFDGAEDALADRYVARARAQPAALLYLASGFHQLNRNWEAIQLGWDVRNAGRPWDRLLLEVIYPFPYRDMVLAEAEEVGVDPFLMAALIRQESAFLSHARSSANARGLMQVLPVTGQSVARRVGPDDFDAAKLYVPDINLHLGASYLKEMLGRYDQDLPLVLSAYNAGPSRANRWRNFPEVSDPVRFTERIPFRETRGYVKNITRNHRMYAFLYGGDASRGAALDEE